MSETAVIRHLSLLRHGKAPHPEGVPDRERPLGRRGRAEVAQTARRIRDRGLVPTLILSSTSQRTRDTVDAFCAAAGCRAEVVYLDSLYLTETEAILDEVRAVPDETRHVLVVGHNPGLASLVAVIAADTGAADLPTGALACCRLRQSHWRHLETADLTLVTVLRPEHGHGKDR